MTVFFDIDDTLYDRGMPFMEAVKEFFGDKVKDCRKAYRTCTVRGNEVFLPSQRGEITMKEMYTYRWGKGFEDAGISISPDEAMEFQSIYRSKQKNIKLSSVIEDMLSYCLKNADGTGIITNGPSQKQWNKIEALGLERYIERKLIIVSGDIGIDKPDPAIFRTAEERCAKSPEELIYVGDSVFNDIEPASECGWHTVWFNSGYGPQQDNAVKADHTVSTEEELLKLIKKII